MPDITPRIGLDSLDQNILLQDTVDRFNKIAGDMKPSFSNPNDAFAPLSKVTPGMPGIGEGYSPNLVTPAERDLAKTNPDLLKRVQDIRRYNQSLYKLSKTDPYFNKGVGTHLYIPYKPIEKYADESMGYKYIPGTSFGEQIDYNEDAYAQVKNTVLNGIGKFVGRTVMGGLAKIGQSMSYVGGLATGVVNPGTWYDMLVNDEDYLTAAGDNIFSKTFDYLDKDVKNDWMPVYQEAASKGQGFWYRLTHDSSFYTNEISDGVAFALSAFVPALAASKLGLGARAVALASRSKLLSGLIGAESEVLGASAVLDAQKTAEGFAAATKYMQNAARLANFVDKSTVTLANTFSEAYFESRETQEVLYNKLLEQGVPEAEAKQRSMKAAKGTFWANIPALLFSNAFETKLQFKALGHNRIAEDVVKGITQAEAFGKYAIEQPVTKFGKFLASPVGFYVKHLPEAIFKEGYWEENIQGAIQRYYQNPDNSRDGIFSQMGGILKQYARQTVDATLGNDVETSTSIGLGGLIGAGHTMISSAIANEYSRNKAFREEVVKNLNDIQDNWLKYGDPYERDANGNVLFEDVKAEDGTVTRQPKVSIPRMLAYTLKVNQLSETLGLTDNVRNDLVQGFTKNALFAELAIANINAGTIETFKANLKNAKNYSDEDLAKIGFKKGDDFNKSMDEKLALVDKIEKLENSINQDVLFKKMNSKEDVDWERKRHSELLRSGVIRLLIDDELQKANAEYERLGITLNGRHAINETDDLVKNLNELQAQIKYNENVSKDTDIDPEQAKAAANLAEEQKKEQEKLLKDNTELADKIKKNEDGTYKYNNPNREKDPDHIRFKKLQDRIAQLTNSHKLITDEWYKNADVKNGLENFKKNQKAKAIEQERKLAEVVEKAQAQEAEQKKKVEEENPFLKYKELEKGDFEKVSKIATAIAMGDDTFSQEDNTINERYADLIKDLIPVYSRKLAEVRKAQLERNLTFLQQVRDDGLIRIIEHRREIGNLTAKADELINDYKNSNSEVAKKKLVKLIKGVQKDIDTIEKAIAKTEAKLENVERNYQEALREYEENTPITAVVQQREVAEKQKAWLDKEIKETKSLIDRLKKLLRELVAIAKKLFIGFDPETHEAYYSYEQRLDRGRHDAVETEGEILSEAMKIEALKAKMKELQDEYDGVQRKIDFYTREINKFKRDFNKFTANLRNQAHVQTAQAAKAKPKYNEVEKALNQIITEETPIGATPTAPHVADYDGEGYMRDLNYVFQSTTDADTRELKSHPISLRHQQFLDYITKLSNAELRAKLGVNGKLKIMYVTGHNIGSFGMSDLVDAKYLDTNDIVNTGIYTVYVLENAEGTFFVDQELNALDKVGQLADKNKKKIVFAAMRAAKWRDEYVINNEVKYGEKERYDVKWPQGATERAMEQAIAMRKRILEETRFTNPTNIVTKPFTITRGIPNRSEGASLLDVRNAVTDVLISEDEIGPDTINIPTPLGNHAVEERLINGVMNYLPTGRPFLITKNDLYTQYHYLNNAPLNQEQTETVKHVLYNLAKELAESIDREIRNMNNGVLPAKDSPQYLMFMGQLARRRRELGISLINMDYINFLKGILFFRRLDESSAVADANERQIWLRGDKIMFGNKGDYLLLDDPEAILTSPELDIFLKDYSHNVNNLQENQRDKTYTEYYLYNGHLETRDWKSYNHYLLSKNYPDGTRRFSIPLTVGIKTRDQIEAEKESTGVTGAYVQRASISVAEVQEVAQKTKVQHTAPISVGAAITGQAADRILAGLSAVQSVPGQMHPATPQAVQTPGGQTGASLLAGIPGGANLFGGQQPTQQATPTPAAPQQLPIQTPLQAAGGEILERTITGHAAPAQQDAATPTPVPTQEQQPSAQQPTPPAQEQVPPSQINPVTGQPGKTTNIDPKDIDDASDIMGDFNFRLSTKEAGTYKVEDKLEERREEVRKMLPQFPVEIVDRLIDTVLGRGAWGQFTGAAIVVSRLSEVGTLYHEAFEAVVNSILTDREWKALAREFRTREGYFTDHQTGKKVKYTEASQYQIKEELAEEFKEYKLTGKKWAGERVKMNIFQKILNFLRSFLGNLATIEETFANMEKGLYAGQPVRLTTRFSNNFKLQNISDIHRHKFLQGATAQMFEMVFNQNRSYVDFDNDRVDEDKLYNDLRNKLRERYEGYLTRAAQLPDSNSTKNAIITAYEQVWTPINNQWEEFVKEHKTFLKPYRIQFVETTDVDENEDRESSNANRNDYQKNIMEIDSKKTASTSVRLLFATLLRSKFYQDNGTFQVNEDGTPRTTFDIGTTDVIFLPELANYDENMKTAFNELSELNNLSRIEEKLKEISGIKSVEQSPNPSVAISLLDNKQAVLVTLYRRLFGTVADRDPDAQWNLKVKFNNFLAKQNPNPELMMVTDRGETYFIESNAKETYEALRRKVNQHLRGMYGNPFQRLVDKNGKVYFQAEIKDRNLTTPTGLQEAISIFFNLGEEFTTDFISKLSSNDFDKLSNLMSRIFSVIREHNRQGKIVAMTLDGFGIEGRVKDLISFYTDRTISGTESSFLNINNKMQQNYVLNNYMSRILADVNYYDNKEDLIKDNPHLSSTYSSTSLLLDRLYDQNGKRTKEEIGLGYMEGIKQAGTQDGTKNSGLSFTDRLILSFNANLAGVYYTLLPADSETEWSLRLGRFVEWGNNFGSNKKVRANVLAIATQYLKTEIQAAQENRLNDLQQTNTKYNDGTRVGDALRIFRDIIGRDPELSRIIQKAITDLADPNEIVNANANRIGNVIMSHFDEVARRNMTLFMNQGIVEREGHDYRFNLLNRSFVEYAFGEDKKPNEGAYYFTEDQALDILRYHAVNYFIANTEMFKVFFGDPVQYKDLTKRIKSFTSGVEWSYYEQSEEDGTTGLNGYLNENKNSVVLTDKDGKVVDKYDIERDDRFHYRHKNHLNLLVVSDLEVVDTELYNQLISDKFQDIVKGLAESADVYKKINEADAQSITDIQTYREIMIKSGWRWSNAHEEQYQYEMAYGRNALARKQKYKYPEDGKLRELDEKILAKYPYPPKLAAFTPIKPLYAGVDNNNKFSMRLLKTSIYPITYRLAEGREMEDLYAKMLEGVGGDRVNIFTFESSQKVGLTLDKNNQITPAYDPAKVGTLNDYNKAGTPIAQLSYKHFGIQVETQSSGYGNTLGTQLTKDIKLNLFDDGAPVDYLESAMVSGVSRNDALNSWYRLPEGSREAASNFYRLYKQHETALRDLKTAGYQELLMRIGATEIRDGAGNVIDYRYNDLTKVHKVILDEMTRRELDENTLDSVQLREDLLAFKRAPETMPSYDIIRNILYAMVDKSILSPKVNGKPYIQVASSFFNSSDNKRKASVFDKDTNQWVELKNVKEHEAAVKAGKKIVYTSSDLGFYKLIKDGKEVQAMEIMLPHIYKQKVNDARKAKGLEALNDEQLVKFLNEQEPKLLEGIGFRIPTQATSSVEFFRIKGFLPETFGGAVVVPSAITAKSGSDFDVDKLNTYLNNWYLDGKGMPRYVKFLDDTNSTVEQRHWSFLKHKYADVLNPVRDALAKLGEDQKANVTEIAKLEADLEKFDTYFNESTLDAVGARIWETVATSIRDLEASMRANDTLRGLEIEGERLIQQVEQARQEYDEVIATLHREMPIERFRALPIGQQNSMKALENRYFQSIRDILSLPYNFQFLLSPNSNENLIENRRTIRATELGISEEEYKERFEKKQDIKHSQFVDFEYMNTQRHYFVRGKQDIGIFAVSMTNYANSQVTGLVVAPIKDIREADQEHLTELNANDFRMPFRYNTITIDGVEYISLSSRFDQDQKSIMDKVSGYINGAVDVAKDPIIMDMGMLSELAGVYAFLERAGVAGRDVALFLKQPIIRDYMVEVQKRKSSLSGRSVFTSNRQIVDYLIDNKYSDGDAYRYEHRILSREEMKRMLGKAAATPNRSQIGHNFTKDEKKMQRLVLANYLKIKTFSDHLQETVQSSNHDTSRIRNNHVIYRKNLQAEEARVGNVIKSINGGIVRPGTDAIKSQTFVGNDVNILNHLEKLFGANIFALQRSNPSRLIKRLGRKIHQATKFQGMEAFERGMRELEISILDYVTNNSNVVRAEGNVPVKSTARALFRTTNRVNGQEVINHQSLKSMYEALMTQIKTDQNHPLKDNFFLKNLMFEDDTRNGISTFTLRVKPVASDIYTRNLLTTAMRQLREYENSSRFYTALLMGAVIQNGIGFRRASINNLIPNEDYGAQLTQGINRLDSENFNNFEEIMARADINSSLVRDMMPAQLNYLAIDKERGIGLLLNTQFVKNRKRTQGNFFGKGPIPGAVFFYMNSLEKGPRDMPEYIKVDTIHPDYILGEEEGYANKVSDEVYEMIKKNDFSFIQPVLFKRVGANTNQMHYITKTSKKGAVTLHALYKPVNYWGSRNFNEYRSITPTDNGEWMGETSILKSNPNVQEMTDAQLLGIVNHPATGIRLHTITNFKNDNPSGGDSQQNNVSSPNGGNDIDPDEISRIMEQFKDDSKNCNPII